MALRGKINDAAERALLRMTFLNALFLTAFTYMSVIEKLDQKEQSMIAVIIKFWRFFAQEDLFGASGGKQ